MSDFLLDSGILIRHLRNYAGYPALLDNLARQGLLFISTMTRFEVLQGMRERERKLTIAAFSVLESLPVDNQVADTAGELSRSWRKQGVTLGVADALIAATALQCNLALLTTNPRHFPMPGLVIYQADETGRMNLWLPPKK